MIMNNNPLVSVIVPNYCHAKYLDQRIESILAQTYTNYELIILDDKSSDNSLEVIMKYQDNPHVSHIVDNEENSGNTFKQWEKGIGLSQGELIWIAESDDYCEPNLLQELVSAFFKIKDCAVAYSTSMIVNETGEFRWAVEKYPNQYIKGTDYVRRYLALEAFIWNASSAIFSKEKVKKIPTIYQKFKGAGDYMFWTLMSLQGNIAIVNKQLNYFRRHDGVVTNTHDADGSNYVANMEILNYMFEHVHFSWLRKRYVRAYRAYKMARKTFANDEIKTKMINLWEVKKYSSLFDKLLYKIGNYIYFHYHYYI